MPPREGISHPINFPFPLTAIDGLQALDHQSLTAQEWAQACLNYIQEQDAQIQAWAYCHPQQVLEQAIARDQASSRSATLWGVPIGIKDIIATADMPTQWGSPLYAGQHLDFNATVVERLQAAGAVLVGKTVTTEYASGASAQTRNPYNLDHTPGASSSGSAAAVAAGMVPLAIGTQTMGSVIRPAAYCGVFGYKPSFGLISRFGILPVSRELDHVGLFARSIADLALLGYVLSGADHRDADTWRSKYPDAADWNLSSLAQPPKLALIDGPFWNLVEPEGQTHLRQVVDILKAAGATITEIDLPPDFSNYYTHVETLAYAGLAVHHGKDYEQFSDRLSPKLCSLIEQGRSLSSLAYAAARHASHAYSQTIAQILCQYDGILTPATTGIAPKGLEYTGNPVFCALWTLTGFPAIAIPSGFGSNGLPLAVQLVGDRGKDPALLSLAHWIEGFLGAPSLPNRMFISTHATG
jgi:Asp-tRNA(Asn)/Glu-tRNA(Gln) amidotransferase A subunit family amidase